jgi:hypothetical protein
MTQESQAIEVEVLAIDGSTPAHAPAISQPPEDPAYRRPQWKKWPGEVRQLNIRWWPLWIIFGVITAGLLLTVGLVLGVLFLIFRTIRNFVRAIIR